MINVGKKAAERIYKGTKHVLRIYKGSVLWYKYTFERWIIAITGVFSKGKFHLTKTSKTFTAEGQTKSNETAILSNRQLYINVDEISISGEEAKIDTNAVEQVKAEGKAISGAEVSGGAGHTRKFETDNISVTAADATLTDHSGKVEAEEQHIVLKDIAQVEAGHARPQEAKDNKILFTQKTPTADKGLTMSKPVQQDMHIKDVVSAGAGHAKGGEAEAGGIFGYRKPEMLAQKIVPKPQEIKAFFKNIVSFGSGHARPQEAKDNKILFTAEKSTLEFGNVLPETVEQKIHIGSTVLGGVGHAKGGTAEGKVIEMNFAQITGETHDVTAETKAYFKDNALFGKSYGKGFEAENGGISGGTGDIYKPKKQLEIDNAGGISGADSKIYKPDTLMKTDTFIRSGAFARLFRVVQLSATTTAKLITQPPLFRYVFLGASGGGVSSGAGLLGKGTYEELFGWAVQYDNVLYIFQSNTAAQAENVLSIDSEAVEAWHTQTDNVLFINIASTAEQTDSELAIDTLVQLSTDEWAVQTDNALLINGIVENTEIEVI